MQVYEELLQLLSAPPTRFRVKHTVIHPTDRYGNTAAKGGKGYAPKPIPWENHRFSGFPPFDAKTALSPRVPVWEVIERQQRVSNNLDQLRTKREEIQQAVKNAQHQRRWSALRREKEPRRASTAALCAQRGASTIIGRPRRDVGHATF